MKLFDKPVNLNGTELKEELKFKGIIVETIYDFANGKIGFETDNEVEAAKVVSAHNGTIIPAEPTIEDKLSSVGLTVEDLKTALGL